MNNDIYNPPQSDPQNTIVTDTLELASRISRLGASLLDSIIIIICILPIMYLTGGFDQISDPTHQASLLYNIGIAILGFAVFAVINLKSLINNGQTIGKKVVGIKIVTMQNELPTLKGNLLKRYAVYFLPGQIPVVGQIFSIVNVLFIFGKEQRCIHDLAGSTKVIKSN